jgi:hypothetical protein
MKNHILLFSLATSILVSCGSSKGTTTSSGKITNYYATTTENIMKLTTGMSVEEVTTALDCEPTDFYSNVKNGEKILVYKYRKTYQNVPANKKEDEKYLRGDKPVYPTKDEGNLYVVFDSKTNKLLNYITDSGRASGAKEINESLKIKYKN